MCVDQLFTVKINNCTHFYRPQRAHRPIYQIKDRQDENEKAGVIAHTSPSEKKTSGNPSQAQSGKLFATPPPPPPPKKKECFSTDKSLSRCTELKKKKRTHSLINIRIIRVHGHTQCRARLINQRALFYLRVEREGGWECCGCSPKREAEFARIMRGIYPSIDL